MIYPSLTGTYLLAAIYIAATYNVIPFNGFPIDLYVIFKKILTNPHGCI